MIPLMLGKEAKEAFDKAIREEVLNNSVIILSNAEKCMTELRAYILNSEQVIQQIQFTIDKHTHTEEYEECAQYKNMKSIVERQTYQLKRVLQGLPAFEESKSMIINEEE